MSENDRTGSENQNDAKFGHKMQEWCYDFWEGQLVMVCIPKRSSGQVLKLSPAYKYGLIFSNASFDFYECRCYFLRQASFVMLIPFIINFTSWKEIANRIKYDILILSPRLVYGLDDGFEKPTLISNSKLKSCNNSILNAWIIYQFSTLNVKN